ncbi:MAG: carotenoid 1,2-hydratase [Gammaproteobacteria bacterium]|nr:carotenoid 1,2-hydratase [Gammaproteobacteria bacterium]MYD76276.1 carotenoid 1,2-hydratase [Gammaproteobacteria bacterium]
MACAMTRIAAIMLCVLIAVWAISYRFTARDVQPPADPFLSEMLSDKAEARHYDRAAPDVLIRFPADHGAHESFRHEWWYFTGNLRTRDDREFGYQLTFFRFAHPRKPDIENAWNNSQTWLGHLAVSDIASGRFHTDQELSRQSLGLAGVEATPFRVWLHGWSATDFGHMDENGLSLELFAEGDGFGIDLEVRSAGPPVLQGENGYSPKSHSGTPASHYYSYPAMTTSGQIQIGGMSHDVAGSTWMDREWSSGILQPGQSGWDWFALRLDDGSRIMAFQIRQEEGEPYRHAVLIRPDSRKQHIEVVAMKPVRRWRSPATGIEYPIGWELEFSAPDGSISIAVESLMPDQEVDLMFRYYEGAVGLTGLYGNLGISGRGYMEMTGYR